MIQQPACLAPFIGVLVDVNKKVRPCCVYNDNNVYPGDLKTETISQIRNNKKWIEIKDNLTSQQVIGGCELCDIREARTGWSLKKEYQNDGTGYPILDWSDGKLQMIEFNGSNICNLACMHCTPKFSSSWVPLAKKMQKIQALGYELGPDDVITKSDPMLIRKNLDELDLSKLQWITLKGGEPLLNEETNVILEYLNKMGILQNIVIYCITNGTVLSNRLLWLLDQAKSVIVTLSIDGNEKLNPYIRWSKKSFATLDNIETTVRNLASISNISIRPLTSVMSYNIFTLVDIRDWWLSLIKKYPNKLNMDNHIFENIVTDRTVSIRNLSDNTRYELIKFYQNTSAELDEFKPVIDELAREYLGNDSHNKWVDYTLGLDQLRGTSILDVEPQLASELSKL